MKLTLELTLGETPDPDVLASILQLCKSIEIAAPAALAATGTLTSAATDAAPAAEGGEEKKKRRKKSEGDAAAAAPTTAAPAQPETADDLFGSPAKTLPPEKITADMLKDALRAYMDCGEGATEVVKNERTAKAKALVAKHGAAKIIDVPEAQWPSLYVALRDRVGI